MAVSHIPAQTPAPSAGSAPSEDAKFRCGTLVYTKAGLFMLFAYLLWGDFCFSLMEAVWPNILPLILKAEGTPNTVIALVITTIPSAMNFVMNPFVGTASDRYRGRLGRRIPFLLAVTPFVTLFLILLGFSQPLARALHGLLANTIPGLPAVGTVIWLICILIIGFRFFELIVNTIFWYLFNDVVPNAFIGRFLGFFRVIGSLAGALFNFFLFRFAESHTAVLFLGVALLYGVAFTMMCLKVREGEYPPPDEVGDGGRFSLTAYVRAFFTECFSHRLFLLVFACSAVVGISNSINTFTIFMAFSIGLDADDFGKVMGMAAFVGIFLMYPMGSLVDRYHPLRIMLAAKIGYILVVAVQLVFLFFEFPKSAAFWIYAAAIGIAIPINVANAAAFLPMYMRLFPHERFGQFCAANAMCASAGTMIGGLSAGWFLDSMKAVFPQGDFYYRFVPAWNVLFMFLALIATYLVFREWKKLGGDKDYHPPIADKFADFHRGT